MKRIALTLLTLATLMLAHAQDYRFEVGPVLGMSGYIGDLNNSNMFKHPGVTGGGIFRYNMNSRWAFRANLNYVSLSGNSVDIANKYPDPEHPGELINYKFNTHMIDVGAQAEFNFLNYGIGARYKQYKRVSPYLTVGLGMAMCFHKGGGSHPTFVLPLGVGVKYKVKERLNLGFEFTMRKDFGDQVDNFTDLYGVKHSFAKNTDWHCLAMFSVTYEFSKRCVKCHYVE